MCFVYKSEDLCKHLPGLFWVWLSTTCTNNEVYISGIVTVRPDYPMITFFFQIVMLSLAYTLTAKSMGFFTLAEWLKGMTELQ